MKSRSPVQASRYMARSQPTCTKLKKITYNPLQHVREEMEEDDLRREPGNTPSHKCQRRNVAVRESDPDFSRKFAQRRLCPKKHQQR
jgi:hypothetical protein